MKTGRAFTLIELMIVIAIIAILALILVPNFLHARSESQTAACEANEKQIATAMEEYAVDHNGAYPSGITNLTTPYLSIVPNDPVNGSPYALGPAAASNGSYEIDDAGGHDTTTTGGLPGGPGNGSIVYFQNSGIRAK